MTTHLVTFHSPDMSQSARLCIQSAESNGVISHSRFTPGNILRCHNIPEERRTAMRSMFEYDRGCGYWSWKPLIIQTDMNLLSDGDILIYADAGIEFINNVNHIIDRMDQDIFLFGNMYEHAHWCKRDIVEAVMGGDAFYRWPWRRFNQEAQRGKQVQASVIFFRVNDNTRAFVKEWLDWCLFEGGRLIDDSPSRTPNHPEFQENRHDQAILTTMAYRDGIKLHWWPAQYNDGAFTYERGDYADEGYPVLFHHHRRRNHEWSSAA